MAKKARKQKAASRGPVYESMCTHAQDGVCIKWMWNEDDQWWTTYSGPCNCSDCHGFLDQNKHAIALAGALEKAKATMS
jgi:hypothetical protein